ncbi:MAG: TonB-dependent receptor [Bacteroidota bacterium]|nr:TonB-dependent receptor [Bacteroidota bacterium]
MQNILGFKKYIIVALLTCSISFSQNQKINISGYVKSNDSGETLIGANVVIKSLKIGCTTNNYGFFSFSLDSADYLLETSYIGYENQSISISKSSNDVIFNLKPTSYITDEVTIKAKKEDANIKNADIGKIEIDVEQVDQIPVLMGEKDILKTIQLLPGVQSGSEGSSGFYVRGGGPDQNLILLDEAVVYNASHLFGFFSVFNSDAINNMDLIKGTMPANYGGRLSSVLDINMKDGNNKKYGATGGIGLISSKLTIEGPIKKDTSSFIISGRRTYFDVLAKPFIDTTAFSGSSYFFYDLTTKANYQLSKKDKLFISGYFGRDVFNFNSDDWGFKMNMPWGNATASLRWNHLFSSKLFMNTSLIFSDYKYELNMTQDLDSLPTTETSLFSGIRDWNLKNDFSYYPNPKHKIKFGSNYVFHKFNPTSFSGSYDNLDLEQIINYYAHEYGVYVNDEFDVNDRLLLNFGLRYSGFTQVGPFERQVKDNSGQIGQVSTDTTIIYGKGEIVEMYGGFEPRFSLRYLFNESSSLKFGFIQNYQYLHLTSVASSSLPTDVWLPSSDVVQPQFGRQISLGYFKNFSDNTYETSFELYYKKMKNLVEYNEGYMPGVSIGLDNIDNNLTFGDGKSYGFEIFSAKRRGNLNGWVGYTYSKTTRQFDNLNNGNWYYAKYDRPHDLSVVLNYQISDRLNLSTVFVYASGNSLTIPKSMYIIDGNLITEWGDLNSYRMDPYHRMDVALTLKNKPQKKFSSSWTLSVYNVYNRKNPYFIYFETEGLLGGTENVEIKAQQVSLFPIIPSISWNFNF